MSSPLQSSYGAAKHGECEPQRVSGPAVGRAMELELIPRLLHHARTHSAPADGPAQHRPIHIGEAEVHRFVQASLASDEERCTGIVHALIDGGVTLERVCLELLAPAARTLGTMWDDDDADFLEVTLGLGRMQRVIRDLGRWVSADTALSADAGAAFLCAMPDEQHSLGLAMVAEFFVADGWGVTVGPPLGGEDVLHEVGAHWYDLIGLSVGVHERIPRVTDLIRKIREASLNADLAIMVGGRAFLDDPALVQVVGADASAPDAAQGPLIGRTLVQGRRAALESASPPSTTTAQ